MAVKICISWCIADGQARKHLISTIIFDGEMSLSVCHADGRGGIINDLPHSLTVSGDRDPDDGVEDDCHRPR